MKRVFIIFLAFSFGLGIYAETDKKKSTPRISGKASEVNFSGFSFGPGETVEIRADSMSLFLNEHRTVFNGKVIVKKGGSVIYCDRLELRYEEQGEINWLMASGNVKLSEGESFASGDELEYFKERNKFYLRGQPRLLSKNQIVMGKEMIFDLINNRLMVSEPEIQFQREK